MTEASAVTISEALAKANAFYDKSDCASAISAYKKIYSNILLTADDKDLITFRSSYCYLQNEQFLEAANGFEKIVEKFPDQDEARLRLAQALFRLRKTHLAQENAAKVTEPSLLVEASLLAAQAEIELGKPEDAIKRLNGVKINKEWFPIFYYWVAVAYFHDGDLRSAKSYFQAAERHSPDNLWVKKEARTWLKQMGEDKWLHGSLVLGYLMDGNLAQQSVLTTDSNGVPTESGPKQSSYYEDDALYLGANVSARLLNESNWSLFSSTSFSSPFYKIYSNYNYKNISTGLSANYKITPSLAADFSTRYLDTRYGSTYAQDYLIFTAGLSGAITPNFYFHVESPFTAYIRTKHYRSYGFAASLRYAFSFATVFGGANYSKTTGPQALYYSYGTLAYVLSGSMFSNSESFSRYLGVSLNLPLDLLLTLQASSSETNYDAENLPAGTLQSSYAARQDSTKTYAVDISKVIIPEVWSIAAAYSYTSNKSIGLQGLASGGQVSDYNYTRPYWMFTTTLGF